MTGIRRATVILSLLPLLLAGSDDEEAAERQVAISSVVVMALLCGLIVWTYLWTLVPFIKKWVPEVVVTIVYGMIIGGIYRLSTMKMEDTSRWKFIVSLDGRIFFLVLLPLCLLESGIGMDKQRFFGNIGSILTYAIGGTLLSAAVVSLGYAIFVYTNIFHFEMLDGVGFSMIISAVDTVATLASLASVGAPPLLFSLVFSESVLNDAVALVGLEAVNRIIDKSNSKVSGGDIGLAIWHFTYSFICSVLLGALSGIIVAFATSRLPLHKVPLLEVMLSVSGALFPYMVAESLDLSGITAILFAGISLQRYAVGNLTRTSRTVFLGICKAGAFLSEKVVNFYLGTALVTGPLKSIHWGIFFATLVLCIAARAISVFGLSALLNLGRHSKIPISFQTVSWWSGLRGATCYVLSSRMRNDSDMWTATSLLMVVATVLIFGVTSEPLIKKLGLSHQHDTEHGESRPLIEMDSIDQVRNRTQSQAFREGAVRASVRVNGSDNVNIEFCPEEDESSWIVRIEDRLFRALRKTRQAPASRGVSPLEVTRAAVLLGIRGDIDTHTQPAIHPDVEDEL